jgi:large subunit ribosomal protein L25
MRAQGRIPAIIYGGDSQTPISVPMRELEAILRHAQSTSLLIQIRLGESQQVRTLLKEVQRDPVYSRLVHADFQEIHEGSRLRVTVPVHLVGLPIGVKDQGGVLDHVLRELDIECLPDAIPDVFEVDVSHLLKGVAVHVHEMTAPAGATIRNPADSVVATVTGRALEAVAEAEAGAPAAEGAEIEKKEGGAEEGQS